MSDKFKVANAPEKDISQMDFRELRKKVQELNDAFNLAMRKLYDTTENLDESNFSSGFLLKQKNMKAQLTATAEAVELRMTAEDLEDKLVNYSTHNQTATAIRTEVGIIKDDLTTNYSTTSQTATAITNAVVDIEKGLSQTLRIDADGVTITNAEGSRLTIDGGQVNADNLVLTGSITWSDLSDGAQNEITSAQNYAYNAYSYASNAYDIAVANQLPDYITSTQITNANIMSPTIYGGIIAGGLFYDNDQNVCIEMGVKTGTWGMYGMKLIKNWGTSGETELFSVYDGDIGYTAFYGKGYNFITTDSSAKSVTAYGTWDFRNATVIGLD